MWCRFSSSSSNSHSRHSSRRRRNHIRHFLGNRIFYVKWSANTSIISIQSKCDELHFGRRKKIDRTLSFITAVNSSIIASTDRRCVERVIGQRDAIESLPSAMQQTTNGRGNTIRFQQQTRCAWHWPPFCSVSVAVEFRFSGKPVDAYQHILRISLTQ